MADEYGYVKISRKAYETDPFWTERRVFSRWEAWEDLIQMAAWKAHRRVVGMTVVDIERGEVLASLRFLATRWKWSKNKVAAFLDLLTEMERIKGQRETQAGTVYLVVNYDRYQGDGTSAGTPEGTAQGQHRDSDGTPKGQREVNKAGKYISSHPSTSREGAAALRVVEGGADPDDQASRIIRAANAAMASNPAIDQRRLRPIPTSHGSRQDVLDWIAEGIPVDVILEAVETRAREYQPDADNRQICTMRYFTAAVREAYRRLQANGTGGSDDARGTQRKSQRQARGTRTAAVGEPGRRTGFIYE